MTRVLTGIKPTGSPHIGNFVGAIQPALKRAASAKESFFFIADMHALNQVQDPVLFKNLTHSIAATWICAGLDPEKSFFYRQSDVPEDFELATILQSFTPKGWMNKSHAYKAAVDKNLAAARDADVEINMGLYSYPVLMAADILLFDANVVPVGPDQVQHIEIARDIAERFNSQYACNVLTVPDYELANDDVSLPGTDGQKMSKSYNNVVPLFASKGKWKKAIYSIVTDSSERHDPKNVEGAAVFDLYAALAAPSQTTELRQGLEKGDLGWGDAKGALLDLMMDSFAEKAQQYQDLMEKTALLDEILQAGAERVRPFAKATIERVRNTVGIG